MMCIFSSSLISRLRNAPKIWTKVIVFICPLRSVVKLMMMFGLCGLLWAKILLRNVVSDLCEKANIESYYSNHSLRVTGAPNESVPHFICSPEESFFFSFFFFTKQRNLAGWQHSRFSNELAGKFITAEGFGLELMTFSSMSSLTGWRNFEK